MEQHVFPRERRRHERTSGLLVRVFVRDSEGQVFPGTVLNASEGGIGLFMDSVPGSEVLEIQPANSDHWISVSTKHCTPTGSGYVVGCAFQSAPTPEILHALNVPR
jgi:PilZ domain